MTFQDAVVHLSDQGSKNYHFVELENKQLPAKSSQKKVAFDRLYYTAVLSDDVKQYKFWENKNLRIGRFQYAFFLLISMWKRRSLYRWNSQNWRLRNFFFFINCTLYIW